MTTHCRAGVISLARARRGPRRGRYGCPTGNEGVRVSYEHCEYRRRWPELWRPLSEDQGRAVSAALANDRLEGGEPSRAEAALLIDYIAGRINRTEYDERADELIFGPR